jgi:hypothetical protein
VNDLLNLRPLAHVLADKDECADMVALKGLELSTPATNAFVAGHEAHALFANKLQPDGVNCVGGEVVGQMADVLTEALEATHQVLTDVGVEEEHYAASWCSKLTAASSSSGGRPNVPCTLRAAQVLAFAQEEIVDILRRDPPTEERGATEGNKWIEYDVGLATHREPSPRKASCLVEVDVGGKLLDDRGNGPLSAGHEPHDPLRPL